MRVTGTASLCERCANNDWQRTNEIKAVFADCGWDIPAHVWCKATDRPEDERHARCVIGFRPMGWSS